jgi:hypothetical protein
MLLAAAALPSQFFVLLFVSSRPSFPGLEVPPSAGKSALTLSSSSSSLSLSLSLPLTAGLVEGGELSALHV